jgi:hypothetical protein
MNYLGVLFAALSTVFYLFIKSEAEVQQADETEPLIDEVNTLNASDDSHSKQADSFFDRLSPLKKRIVGTVLACTSGVLYGITFTPELYVRDNYGESQNGLDYVFSL